MKEMYHLFVFTHGFIRSAWIRLGLAACTCCTPDAPSLPRSPLPTSPPSDPPYLTRHCCFTPKGPARPTPFLHAPHSIGCLRSFIVPYSFFSSQPTVGLTHQEPPACECRPLMVQLSGTNSSSAATSPIATGTLTKARPHPSSFPCSC